MPILFVFFLRPFQSYFNTNIIQLTNRILKLTKIKDVDVYHETNTIDKRSYEVSPMSARKFEKRGKNFDHLTNQSILETFKEIKKDKKPYAKNKITLTVYKEFLEKKINL